MATYIISSDSFTGDPIAMAVKPRIKFGTDQQDVTRDGERKWTVQVVVTPSDGSKPEVIEVTLLGEDPSAKLAVPVPVEFKGLRMGVSQATARDDRVFGGKPYFTADDVRMAVPASGKAAA